MSLRDKIFAVAMMSFAVLSMVVPLALAAVSIFV